MRFLFFILLMCLGIGLQAQNADRIREFREATGASVALHTSTDAPNFIRLPSDRAMNYRGTLAQKTTAFLRQYGDMFGIEDATSELRVKGIKQDKYGYQRYTMGQYFKDVPVFDGQLHFHFNPNENISVVNGNYIPNININPEPTITATAAALIAVEEVTNQNRDGLNAPLYVNSNQLYIFNKGLAKGSRDGIYLVYEVEVRNDLDVREFLYINAHKGSVVEQYTGIACALFRRVYDGNTSSANEIWTEGDPLPGSLDQWQQNQAVAAEDTYYFFEHAFGHTSYDDQDAEMHSIDDRIPCTGPNATWTGSAVAFCQQTASDDVVAHEWGHAYTEYTNNLIYAYESGAINEAFSDIWGETIDLLNNYEDADEDNSVRSGTTCSESNRWKVGEDATGIGGAIRDMWVPGCNGHPDRVTDADYHCLPSDAGGVHINSGIPNHAYALLVDGGMFNGQTITSIGFTKAAHIFWRAQTVYLTQTSDFAVLADALEQACQDLVGQSLTALSTESTPSSDPAEMLTAADCQEIIDVVAAVEMRADNGCGFQPLLSPAPSICSGSGAPGEVIFSEDWEAGIGSWTVAQTPSNAGTWDARDWTLTSSLPDGRTGTGMFGIDPILGNCTSNLENGIISLDSPIIPIGASVTAPVLMTFDHYVSLEDAEDGGHLFYSQNGGAWTLVPASAFTANPYNDNIVMASDNPRAGQPAFTNADEGSRSGTWGQSQIDLSTLGIVPGDNLQLRWEVSTDGCDGWDGWYLDEILVYSCTSPSGTTNISFSTPSSSEDETLADTPDDCLDYYETTIRVQINAAPSEPVDVTVTTTGTATMGANADYTFTPDMFTLDTSTLFQDITVRIYDDAVVESVEDIIFSYTFNANGGNAIAGPTNQMHTITIADNDILPSNVTAGIIFSDDFNSGIGGWTVTDGGSVGDVWTIVPNYAAGATNTLDGTDFLLVDSEQAGNGSVSYETITSPVINAAGATNMTLTFDQYFNVFNAGYREEAIVEIFDGTTWQTFLTQTQTGGDLGGWLSPDLVSISIPDSYATSNLQVRFIYDAEWDWYWAIDNVEIVGDASTVVQSPVNVGAGDEQYLGPNAEVYFYDPATGNIMASIKNLTAHDYGCTTVEVERAGTASEQAWSPTAADYIASKTFQVTPDNNDPTGSYEISLYYTEAEIAGWETVTGRVRADLMHIRTPDDLPTPTAADTRTYLTPTVGTYGTDWIYTATYNTGFSDFGIGPVEPSVSVAPKVFLQGPLSAGVMADDLRQAGLVPTTEPYTTLGYTHVGGGGETVASARLATTGAKAVVDWVIVEARDAATGTMVLASRSALLLSDGSVVDTDGVSPVRLRGITAGDYYIAVRHRNHLGVMTASTVTLN